MRVGDWDERWLPRAAAVTQQWAQSLRERMWRWTGPGSLVGDGVRAQPALAGSTAAVLVAALVLAIAGGPGGPPDESATPIAPVTPVPAVGTTLGPAPGTSVATYLVKAAADLRHFDDVSRGKPGYAVIDLDRYVSPAVAERLFAGQKLVRAYARVPGGRLPTQVHAIPLEDNFALLDEGMLASGRLATATAKTFQVLVTQLSPSTPNARQLKARYSLQEQASSYEGQRLSRPATCSCVFAVVVKAAAVQLAAMARTPGIRIVDPAPPTTSIDALTVFPLEPEVRTVVPKGGLFGA
jgi:hypothetical protein